MKIKESENTDKYLDLSRAEKTVKHEGNGTLGTIPKGLEKRVAVLEIK